MTGAGPSVSVIIPHFNRSDLVADTVASVLASDTQSVDIIIVDDGSTREHLLRLQGLRGPRVRVMSRESGLKGPSRCRNIGADASTSAYLIFLDSDDLLAPWCVGQRLAAASANDDADMWVFPVMLFDEAPGDRAELWNVMGEIRDAARRFISSDPPWHTSSPLWRREAFMTIGGFNEAVFYGDDSDLHMRALLSELPIQCISNAIPDVFIRRSGTPRITNVSDADAWAMRRARLVQASSFLRATRHEAYLPLVEAQYFAEAEWFVFNGAGGDEASKVMQQWEDDFPSSTLRSPHALAYLAVARLTRRHAYPLLRLARRLAMSVLPANFFSVAPWFHRAKLDSIQAREMRIRLGPIKSQMA